MSYTSPILQQLASQPLQPVYVVLSTSDLLRHEAVRTLQNRVVQNNADFNCDIFDAQTCEMPAVMQAANCLPVMATHRFVHVGQFHKLKNPSDWLVYLQAPNPTTVLCLSGTKIDMRTKFASFVKSLGAVYTLNPPRPQELPAWLHQRAKQQGYNLTREACALLTEQVGHDLDTLAMAIETLITYAGENKEITYKHVLATVVHSRMNNVFELIETISQGTWHKASLLLQKLLQDGEPALLILSMLNRQLRQLLQVITWQQAGIPEHEQAPVLKIPPFAIDKLNRQARRYPQQHLQQALKATMEADWQLKSSATTPNLVLEALLLKMLPR